MGVREPAMQTIYPMRTVRAKAKQTGRTVGFDAFRRALVALLVLGVFALCWAAADAARAQPAGPPVGMVEAPCPPPLSAPSPGESEADVAARQEAAAQRRRNDWAGLCRHRAANATLGSTPVEAVFIGDSITEFWEAAAPELFRDGVINRGIGAQTSPQMLVRFYPDVVALHPRVVHILAGTNDVAGNSGPNRPEDFKNNIRAMTDLAQANGIAVVIGAIPPADVFYWRPELRPAAQIADLNAWLKTFAEARGARFVDYHAAMAGPAGALKSTLTADGVHPDARGFAVMTPLARAAIDAALRNSR